MLRYDCNPAECNGLVILGVDGNDQHATAAAGLGMRPSVLLVVSPSLFTHDAGRGLNALDRETVFTDRLNIKHIYIFF